MKPMKTSRALILIFIMIGVMVFSGCAGKIEPENKEQSRKAAVQVAAGALWGNGVIYEAGEDELVIVTAGHVLAQAGESVRVVFYDGVEVEVTDYVLTEGADCGFLIVSYALLPAEAGGRYKAVEKNRDRFDSLQSGEEVYFVSISEADPDDDVRKELAENKEQMEERRAILTENWIYVEDFAQYMMLLQGRADSGMSGSGVFDEEGCFLGILCGGNENEELAVLPYSVIDALYQMMR